jgi:nicotinamidase/pyrazinamidase
MKKNAALIIVDLQRDFCAGGPMAVPGVEKIIPVINRLQSHFPLVVATKDWHPANHSSFASNHPGHSVGEELSVHDVMQVLWPDHCVQKTLGAEFHPDLERKYLNEVFFKGTDKRFDSYSAFYDNTRVRETGLTGYLRVRDVTDIYIVGVCTEYCVKFSALDAVRDDFNVTVIQDACAGIDLVKGNVAAALVDMQKAGINLLHSSTILD